MKKRNNDVIIEFLGTSRDEVTGSCVLVSYVNSDDERENILIECGMNQGCPTMLSDYNTNKRMVEKIPFSNIKYIFVNHVHVDHIGNLPTAFNRGFTGNVIATEDNRELMIPLLNDTYTIHLKNVKKINEKGKNLDLLFNKTDVHTAIHKTRTFEKNIIHKLNETLSFRFLPNNHCVGSCQLELFIKKPSGKVAKIFYSSDLGSNYNSKQSPFLDDIIYSTTSDISIFEATYGNKDRNFAKKEVINERKDLITQIKKYTSMNHRVLIPSFSFSRSQMLMSFLYDNLKDDKDFDNISVIVDSKLLNDINGVYSKILKGENKEYWEQVLSWSNFHFVKEFKDTETIIKKKDIPMVIISSSGMCNAGHVVSYAKSILLNPNDCMIFVGYCGLNTLGNMIQNNRLNSVTINREIYEKKCDIISYKTFSSHIQQAELIDYMKKINTGKILLHHGSTSSKEELKLAAKEELFKANKTTPIEIVTNKNKEFRV